MGSWEPCLLLVEHHMQGMINLLNVETSEGQRDES